MKKIIKTYKINHPITFASGLFKGSQLNWAALTKEAFAIYSSIKKLSYYLEDADIDLRSDHLPLKKFLHKNTLNTQVNNWAVEISPYRIHFEYIKGIKNTLADTMSRLSAYLHYAVVKTQIANLEKLTALSEEAVKLICGSYSPYSKL